MHPVRDAGISGGYQVAAHGVAWRKAVAAFTCDGARCVLAQTDAVRRAGVAFDPFVGCVYVRCDLVGADDVDDLVRSPDDRGYPVAGTVDVDDFAVQGDGVGACQHEVRGEDGAPDGFAFFRIRFLERLIGGVVPLVELIEDAQLVQSL